MTPPHLIGVDAVSKRYGSDVVVDDVTLDLGTPGITSIIGPNGAGKSTLLSMIGRLLPLDGGRITVDGLDVKAAAGSEVARRLAVLRQDNHLAARLTVVDLVGFGRFPHSRGRLTADDRRHIDAAIDYLDLGAFRGRFLDELSGGQRQRAFIAMVMAQDTAHVLLDEPLNSLDLRHAVDIMRLLRRTADERDRRVLVVLHDVNVAATYSDRIVAMADGRVVAAGPPSELIRPDVLEEVYGLPVDVHEIDGRRVVLTHP